MSLSSGPGLVPGPRLPRDWRWLVPLALLLVLVVALLTALWWGARAAASAVEEHRQPQDLSRSRLTGPRGPGCLRLVLGVDDSGSMKDAADARDRALSQLIEWIPDNLRHDDEVAVIDFAATAAERLPVTGATSVTTIGGIPAGVQYENGTLITPLANQLASQPVSGCRRALALISDGQFTDLPSTQELGRSLVRRGHVDDVLLLVPGKQLDVPREWVEVFPAAQPRRFNGRDKDETAIAIGRALAELTGQELERTS